MRAGCPPGGVGVERPFVAGVDVSDRRGLDVAVLGPDGDLLETTWLPGLAALGVWLEVWADRLAVVGVDAPDGLACRPGGREAERVLLRRGVSLYSTPVVAHGAPRWMAMGWRVYDLLRERGFPALRTEYAGQPCAIECYPYAAYVALSGRRRVGDPAAWARAVLRRHGYEVGGTGKDAADALAAALPARAHLRKEAVCYGDPAEGVIWAPCPLPERLGPTARAGDRGAASRAVPSPGGSRPSTSGGPPHAPAR